MATGQEKKRGKTRSRHSAALTQAIAQVSDGSGSDVKRAVVKNCLAGAFLAELHRQIEETDTIVWNTLDDRVILKIGDAVTDCINSHGYNCPLLAPSFQSAKDNNVISLVSALIDALAAAVTP